jgi:hypothetical protein
MLVSSNSICVSGAGGVHKSSVAWLIWNLSHAKQIVAVILYSAISM